MTEQMTEEGLNFLETRAKSESYISMRDILDLIRLARVGLAVQPRPIAEAHEDTACIIMGNQIGDMREIAHYNSLRKAWVANWDGRLIPTPTHFIPLSALPKPGE